MSLTSHQKEHLGNILCDFYKETTAKYTKGVLEHGGNLWDKTSLELVEEAMNETIDQYVYLHTLRDKLRGAL